MSIGVSTIRQPLVLRRRKHRDWRSMHAIHYSLLPAFKYLFLLSFLFFCKN
uniref:Uncharacterized protein n=1 Tax=Rhizophora mucronata TaxID=61149 RepID=A0A2P2JEE9_RHIMU